MPFLTNNYLDYCLNKGEQKLAEEKIAHFCSLLLAHNQRINLIGKSTEEHIYQRHILDSAQLARFLKTEEVLFDFGSGAGFPGIILAILGVKQVVLFEKSAAKSKFLATVTEALELAGVKIVNADITGLASFSPPADVIVARAFASLENLLKLTFSFAKLETRFVLPKGKSWGSELASLKSRASWDFDLKTEASVTNDDSKILIISNLRRKQ